MGAKRRRPKGKKDTPEKRDAAERASRRTAYLELLSKTMQSDQKESGPYASCNTQYTGETAKACKKIVYETGETAMACKKILDETGETAMACKEIADLQTQLVGIQTRMLTALDPKTRVDELVKVLQDLQDEHGVGVDFHFSWAIARRLWCRRQPQ